MKRFAVLALFLLVAVSARAQGGLGVAPVTTQPPGAMFSCFKDGISALTECQAVAATGLKNYVTSVICSNQAATVQTVDVVYGTGTNCGTNTTALSHKFQLGTNGTTTSPIAVEAMFTTPLVPATATAICLRPANATAFGCTVTGYTGP